MNETIKFDKGISIIIPIHEGMTYIEELIKNLNDLIVKDTKNKSIIQASRFYCQYRSINGKNFRKI